MANAERRQPPAWVRGIQQTPQRPVRKPVDRHLVTKVTWEDQGERGDRNTMIEPWVDIQADLDAINRDEAIVDRQHATAWINGRLWGFHADTGTAYPMEGDGLVRLNQLQYFALRTVARYNGDPRRSGPGGGSMCPRIAK